MSADRVRALEHLVAQLRHDVRGLLTPMMLRAEHLAEHVDPLVAAHAKRIADGIDCVAEYLRSTYELVEPLIVPPSLAVVASG